MSQIDQLYAAEQGKNRKTLTSYLLGFFLCIILTLTAFALVEFRLGSTAELYISLAMLACAQLLVQCVCFLRLNASREGQERSMPFLFTIFIIAILVSGTLWIMYNLNYYMSH